MIPIKRSETLSNLNYVQGMISLQREAKARNDWKWLSLDLSLGNTFDSAKCSSDDRYEIDVAQDLLIEHIPKVDVRVGVKMLDFPFELVLELKKPHLIGNSYS